MPKSKQEEVDVLNKARRESGSVMQKAMFDAVVQTDQAQRQKDENEKAGREEHYKARVKSMEYKKNQENLQSLTHDMKRALTAMDSLATILFSIGSQAEALKNVTQYRIEQNLKGQGINLNVREHITSISGALFKQIVRAVKDKMTDPDVYLPGVIHYVELDESSKVKDAPLRFSSNIFVTQAQNDIFNADFRKWLLKNEYKENSKTGQVEHIKTGLVITKEAFEALRDNPEHGLTRYLKDEWKMQNIKQEKARVEAPKEEPDPKKEAKKRERDEGLDEAEDHAPRPRPRR